MKTYALQALAAMTLCCSQALAQNVMLPFGQDSHEPWTAKYYHAPSGEDINDSDWYSADFDDSQWPELQGPISSETSTRLDYYNTVWDGEYSTYWVRRHFNVDNLDNTRLLYLRAKHDDGCKVYLNGYLIYDYSSLQNRLVDVTSTAKPYLKTGENVIAVRVDDNGGAYAYMDFGLYGSLVGNPGFDSSYDWSGYYSRYEYAGNYIGYNYGGSWTCEQTIKDLPAGLYCLSANACALEDYGNYDAAYASQNRDMAAKLFINDLEQPVLNAFADIAENDIYTSYRWEVNGGYVPYYVDRVPAALARGMYHNELYTFYEPGEDNSITVGIHCYPDDNRDRWAAWDNLNLTYYSEEALRSKFDALVKEFTDYTGQPVNAQVKATLESLLAAGAETYREQARAFAEMMQFRPTAAKSIQAYARLIDTREQLIDALAKSSSMTSPATIAEARAYSEAVNAACQAGEYDNDDIKLAVSKMQKMIERLGYLYLDITITTPGAMGDSILSKVENFVDVYSIKISGTPNDADITTLTSRMSNLREIDMSGLKLNRLPNRMFYQHNRLEIIVLPDVLEAIGEYALAECQAIKHINMPASLTTIENDALRNNTALESVTLPEGLTRLGHYSFCDCTNLRSVRIPGSVKVIEQYAFYNCRELASVEFAEGLTEISARAFSYCYKLDNVVFPGTLYIIHSDVFAYNRSLKNVTFNEGLFQIADNAFYDCDALEEVTLPSTLVLANASPFDYCDNLRKVTCLSIEPPYMTDQIPYGLSMEGRELYVPAISINAYKQTAGWDKFPTIKPIDYLPENIYVYGDLHLTLPEDIPADYKPNVLVGKDMRGGYYWQYGKLTVNGAGTLSMADYSMGWDYYYLHSGYMGSSDCFSSLVNNSHLRADNVSVSLSLSDNNRWTFVSFPFDVKVSDIEAIADGTTNWVIRKYDGKSRAAGDMNETWVKLSGDDVLSAGEGCIMQAKRYINGNPQSYSTLLAKAINNGNKNNIFRTGDISVKLNEFPSEFAHNRSWNYIGNPYPSFYDTRYMDFSSPITVWDWYYNTYAAYSPVDDAYILCPGEAFFVQRPVDVESITFGKEGRQTDRAARAFEAPAKAPALNAASRTVVNLTLTDGASTDRTRVVINDSALMDYECATDAAKFLSSASEVPQLFSSCAGVDYAINERPLADGEVSLSARFGADGQYTIALASDIAGYDILLEDRLAGKTVRLTQTDNYSFTAKAGTDNSRFVLHIVDSVTGITSAGCDAVTDDAYYTIDGIKVDTPVRKGIYILKNKKVIVK